jgi:choline dehydrogenase-like flavoprotein
MSNASHDYLVVGAGAAGCIVANRLTASGRHTVLLLEAGGRDTNPWIPIPAGISRLLAIPDLLWLNRITPKPEFGGRSIALLQGKLLGGGTSINGMMYVRGQRGDYNSWSELGCTGWSWDEVLPYFKKSECLEEGGSDAFHGRSGELKLSWMKENIHDTARAFLEAAQQGGLRFNEDMNSGVQEGIGYLLGCIYKGRRQSTANTFLRAAAGRPNLETRTTSLVRRVLFEERRAVGVEIEDASGTVSTVRCNREVLLCAGTLSTPLVLQRSGVGDAAHLASLGIQPVVDLPQVGKNLQDHLFAHLKFRLREPRFSLNATLSSMPRMALEAMKWLLFGTGWLNVTSSHLTSFFRSGPDVDRPDVQASMRPFTFTILPSGAPKIDDFPGMTVSAIQTHPYSRGEARIRSRDPHEDGTIDANYLSDPRDIAILARGLARIRGIMRQPAIADRVVEEVEPGADVTSPEALEHHLRTECQTVYHPVGTCRMGADADAVLDPALRVRGVQGLRVIDASVMPVISSGNTVAPAMMIGEKGADLTLADAR